MFKDLNIKLKPDEKLDVDYINNYNINIINKLNKKYKHVILI